MKVKKNKTVLYVSLVTFLISILLLIYFINFGPSLSKDQNDWGTFGDYIGGVMGIILTGLSIVLLYQTYNSQKDQINLLRMDLKIKYLDLQYDQIIKDIYDISYKGSRGSDALYKWDECHTELPNNVVNTLNFILHSIKNHLMTIELSKDLEEKVREDFLCRSYLMIHSKIVWPIFAKLYDDKAFQNHTDNLYCNFNNLTKETYRYLVPRGKLVKPDDKRLVDLIPEFNITTA